MRERHPSSQEVTMKQSRNVETVTDHKAQELHGWKWRMKNKPDEARREVESVAKAMQSRDKSDPFTYSRVKSLLLNEVASPDDFARQVQDKHVQTNSTIRNVLSEWVG